MCRRIQVGEGDWGRERKNDRRGDWRTESTNEVAAGGGGGQGGKEGACAALRPSNTVTARCRPARWGKHGRNKQGRAGGRQRGDRPSSLRSRPSRYSPGTEYVSILGSPGQEALGGEVEERFPRGGRMRPANHVADRVRGHPWRVSRGWARSATAKPRTMGQVRCLRGRTEAVSMLAAPSAHPQPLDPSSVPCRCGQTPSKNPPSHKATNSHCAPPRCSSSSRSDWSPARETTRPPPSPY